MVSANPHYYLYSAAESSPDCGSAAESAESTNSGWHFILQSADGAFRLEAADEEAAADEARSALLAVVRGLEALDQPSRVTLITANRYVSHGLRFGLEQWRENGWCWERFGEMEPVRNHDLWQRLDRALQFHELNTRQWRVDGPHPIGHPAAAARQLTLANSPRTDRKADAGCQEEAEAAPGSMGRQARAVRGSSGRCRTPRGARAPHQAA